MRVLIVSEVAAERLRASSALALRTDVEVREADSGEQARRQVIDGELDPDILVVDGDLQPRGGFALLYDLREKFELDGRRMPRSVVLIARAQDRFLVEWSGADRYLIKPVDPFLLADVVGELAGEASPA